MQLIQSSITGFTGRPQSVYSVYDDQTGVLLVSVVGEFARARRKDCAVVTNDENIQDRESLFTTDHFGEAIEAYFTLRGGQALDGSSARLAFKPEAQSADPRSSIESDGYTEAGPRYRVNDIVSNQHIAVLATCWHIHRAGQYIDRQVTMADSLARILRGEVLTI